MASTDHGQESAAGASEMRRWPRRGIGRRIVQAIAALALALVIAGIAALATAELGVAELAFAIAFIASAIYLYMKPLPSAAIGSGLYLVALLVLVAPILIFLPEILGEVPIEGTESAAPFVERMTRLVAVAIASGGLIIEAALALFVTAIETAVAAFGEELGLLAVGLAFVIVALVIAGIGYVANRRAKRKLTVRPATHGGSATRDGSERRD